MKRGKKSLLNFIFIGVKETGKPAGIAKVSNILSQKISNLNYFNFHEVQFKSKGKDSLLKKLLILFQFLLLGLKNSKVKKGDILFSSNYRLPYFLPKNILKIIFVHDLIFLTHPKTMRKTGLWLDKIFVNDAIRRSDLIICPSYSTRNDIVRFYPKYSHKCRVVHLASPLGYLKEKIIDNSLPKKYILCVGTIEPRKNYERIIYSYNSLPDEIKRDYALIIIGGKGWGNINLQKIVSDLGLSNRIFLKTYVTDSYLKFIIKNAYVLLFPSLYEGFGLPILEAHAEGIPVITSNISSMPEVAGEGALYVNPYSTDSISNSLLKIIKDKKLRDYLSTKSIINSKKFSWDFTVEKLIQSISY